LYTFTIVLFGQEAKQVVSLIDGKNFISLIGGYTQISVLTLDLIFLQRFTQGLKNKTVTAYFDVDGSLGFARVMPIGMLHK
jgi:hypothetical protein